MPKSRGGQLLLEQKGGSELQTKNIIGAVSIS